MAKTTSNLRHATGVALLARKDGVLISGWYQDDGVSNFFIYILDLKRRLLVKLASLSCELGVRAANNARAEKSEEPKIDCFLRRAPG
jgi:hypothetical protein